MLDARTLIFAVSITLITTFITVFISGIINRNIAGVREWMSGYGLLAFGLLLQGSQGLIHPLASVFIANIIIPCGFAMIWLGLRRYKGKTTPRYSVVLGSIAVFMIAMHALSGVDESGFVIRTIFMSSVCAIINLLSARTLLKSDKSSTPGEHFTGVILTCMAIALIIRAVTTYNLPDSMILTTSNTHNYFTYMMAMIFNILFSFGLVIMPSERLQNRLSHLADTDFLTGIMSRRAFANYANRAIGRQKDNGQELALILFDIDDFKSINDKYGHSAGDAVLQDICQKIKIIIRGSDFFGRIGGEEFAILLTDASLATAKTIAERIRQAIQDSATAYDNRQINSTISLGLTKIDPQTESFEEAYKSVDYYLYQAKNEGKNRIVCAMAG